MKTLGRTLLLLTTLSGLLTTAARGEPQADTLRAGWDNLPAQTKPHVYWYWLNNIITKTGITRDLEAMARKGIGGAYIAHIGFFGDKSDTPQNETAKPLSDPWYEQLQHAVREGLRTGVQIGVFNGPGWSQSGGPWVKPEDSMVYIDNAELRVSGGKRFDNILPRIKGAIEDVRVIAFPAPSDEGTTINVLRVTSNNGEEFAALADGKPHTLTSDKFYQPLRLTFELDPTQTVRSVIVRQANALKTNGTLFVSDDGKTFTKLHDFTLDRRAGPKVILGTRASVVSVPPTKARFFRIELPWRTAGNKNGNTLGVTFSSAARLEMAEEKQLGVASSYITPPWDTFIWPATPEPGKTATVAPAQVIDLTDKTAADGRLQWDVPAGEWIVQRLSTHSTGAGNGPAPKALSGLEIDKMSRRAASRHIADGPIGQLWNRLKPEERAGFKFAIGDSYEKGLQNWTPGLETQFKQRYGYDPIPWLPVLSGRVVGSAAESDRFLWDLRRIISDLIAQNYVGGIRDAIRPMGLTMWLENYGHFGFPAEFLSYGGASDGIGGEFWLNKPISRMEMRGAASAAHIYGKQICSAEAFTSAGSTTEQPGDLKTRGDLAFAEGINHFVLHVVSHQPTEVPGPGMMLLWGVNFNRNTLWFAEHGKAWVDYVRRTSYLLQQGRPAADIAYFIGEDVPQMTGILDPALPAGYDFDFVNAEVLMTRAKVEGGRLVLPGGASYAVLALPPTGNMRPELLERIAELVNDGLTIVGTPPKQSPSLQDYPRADDRVKSLVAGLWPAKSARERAVGKGHVWRDASLEDIFKSLSITPAILESNRSILWKQRTMPDAEIFFLSNQTNRPQPIAPSFRVAGRVPEVWNAETSTVETLAVYREEAGRTIVPMTLAPSQAVFVVFRQPATTTMAVTDVRRDGKSVLAWTELPAETETYSADSNLTQSFWVKPSADIRLPTQSAKSGDLSGQRWVVVPPRGPTAHGPGITDLGADYAVTGISVGTNGIAAFQRAADRSAPVLVWAAPQRLNDWTHVVLVYREGVPHLFVDGHDVATGEKTGKRLIAGEDGTAEGSDSGSPYESSVRGFRTTWRTIDDAALAAVAASGKTEEADVRILRDDAGVIRLQTAAPGAYTLQLADGKSLTATVSAAPPPAAIERLWQVTFQGAAAPAAATWEKLQSWSDSKDELTRYFSGSATYITTFTLPANYDADTTRCDLDLGEVEIVARVEINGQPAGTALREPYRLDVSSFVKPGENTLKVFVTDTWANRMIGDEQFPDDLAGMRAANGNLNRWPDWAFTGAPRPEPRRITLSSRKYFSNTSPLPKSGLIGPVTLHFEANVAAK